MVGRFIGKKLVMTCTETRYAESETTIIREEMANGELVTRTWNVSSWTTKPDEESVTTTYQLTPSIPDIQDGNVEEKKVPKTRPRVVLEYLTPAS